MAKIIGRKMDRTKQMFAEKTGRGKEEATQIAGEYKGLERLTDSTAAILEHLQGKTKELLQPNPNARLKMDMQNSFQKIKVELRTRILVPYYSYHFLFDFVELSLAF